MISGANDEELTLANARADIIIKLDNTSTYESWLIVDTYIEQLQQENKELKEKLGQKNKVIEEIKNIIQKHTYTQKDDYYDYCEQGISIVDSDDDYDKLIDILNKGVQ